MSQQELLNRVVATLKAIGIDYMVVGSIASSVQGKPRSTHDIDVVVAIRPDAATQLVASFPSPDYYFDLASLREAIKSGGMVNLLDVAGGDKVVFWMLADNPYDKESFARRYSVEVGGIALFMQRPEDTILSKLRWAQMSGGSEKQFTDALRVYEVQFGIIESEYIDRWAVVLGVQAEWDRLRSRAVLPK